MRHNHFEIGKIYIENEINEICKKNHFYTTDCVKDDNQITVSEFEDTDPIYEFTLLKDEKFKLTWKEKNDNNTEKRR